MKILFLTNMPSYNQMELSEQFNKLLGDGNFCIAITSTISDERKEMKWQDEYQQDYLLRLTDESSHIRLRQWIETADAVIYGRVPIRWVRSRIRRGQLTFAYQERLWKRGKSLRRLLTRAPFLYQNYWSLNKSNHHFLAAGAYAASDMQSIGMFAQRMWKFGYFIDHPKMLGLPEIPVLPIKLVWCGRLMPLKQPELALRIAEYLKKQGIQFSLKMIGGGELLESITNQVKELGLSNEVDMLGWQSRQQVAGIMAESHILLATSNQREGWGVVVNEAISHGCAVFASQSTGAANWLVGDTSAGLVFNDDNFHEQLNELVKACNNSEVLRQWSSNARLQHQANWSTEQAAQRLCVITQELLTRGDANVCFDQGCCSPA